MKTKILKHIKKQLKIQRLWKKYKKLFKHKRQRFFFVFLDRLFDLKIPEKYICEFEKKFIFTNLERDFEALFLEFINLSANKSLNKLLVSNLAIFLYYSFKRKGKISFENEAKRRDCFNNFSLLMMQVSPDFNFYVIKLLEKFK